MHSWKSKDKKLQIQQNKGINIAGSGNAELNKFRAENDKLKEQLEESGKKNAGLNKQLDESNKQNEELNKQLKAKNDNFKIEKNQAIKIDSKMKNNNGKNQKKKDSKKNENKINNPHDKRTTSEKKAVTKNNINSNSAKRYAEMKNRDREETGIFSKAQHQRVSDSERKAHLEVHYALYGELDRQIQEGIIDYEEALEIRNQLLKSQDIERIFDELNQPISTMGEDVARYDAVQETIQTIVQNAVNDLKNSNSNNKNKK